MQLCSCVLRALTITQSSTHSQLNFSRRPIRTSKTVRLYLVLSRREKTDNRVHSLARGLATKVHYVIPWKKSQQECREIQSVGVSSIILRREYIDAHLGNWPRICVTCVLLPIIIVIFRLCPNYTVRPCLATTHHPSTSDLALNPKKPPTTP